MLYGRDDCRVPRLLDLWNANGGLLVEGGLPGPGGGTVAFAVTEPVTEGPIEFYLDWFFTMPKGQLYPRPGRFSIAAYMKANGREWAWLDAGNGAVDRYAYFDLAMGDIGETSGPDIVATITSVGGGWFLCEMSGESELYTEGEPPFLADDGTVSIGPADEDGGFGYIGDGTGFLISGVAFEAPGQDVAPYDPG